MVYPPPLFCLDGFGGLDGTDYWMVRITIISSCACSCTGAILSFPEAATPVNMVVATFVRRNVGGQISATWRRW